MSMMPAQQMHKLTNVEAQRIMAILEETYSKLELISKVPPLQLPEEDALYSALGADVLQLLQEQVVLEQQYEWVSAPQSEQKMEHDVELPDFETLDDELRHSTRVVCRMLREAPGIVARLQEASLMHDIDCEPSVTMQAARRPPRPPRPRRVPRCRASRAPVSYTHLTLPTKA